MELAYAKDCGDMLQRENCHAWQFYTCCMKIGNLIVKNNFHFIFHIVGFMGNINKDHVYKLVDAW